MKSAYWPVVPAALALIAAAPPPVVEPIPGLGNFSLPESRATPTPSAILDSGPDSGPAVTPTPAPTAAPTTTPSPRPSRRTQSTPVPAATTTPSRSPTREPAPSPTASPSPASRSFGPTVLPDAAPMTAPVATPTPAPTIAGPATGGRDRSVWLILAVLVALAAGGLALLGCRRRVIELEEPIVTVEDTAPPARASPNFLDPTPAPAPISVPVERAWIEPTVVPRRAGVNMVTATVDVDVTLHNAGTVAATRVRVDIRLLSASTGQDAELGMLFATPIDRPAVAAFDLAPGDSRTIRKVVTLPRAAIVVLTAGGRPMFVPVLALNVTYGLPDGATGQSAAAYAIGIERAGAAKLAPFWLDGPSRMHEALGIRPHALSLRS